MEILTHAGHNHGPDPTLIALLIAAAVLAITATIAAVRARHRSRGRTAESAEERSRQ